MPRVFITGLGILNVLGDNVAANRLSLQQGKSGIGKVELFPTRYADLFPFGEIKTETEAFKRIFNIKDAGVTRTTLLAIYAFEQAINDSKLSKSEISDSSTVLIGGNTVGGMCLTDELYKDAISPTEGSEYVGSYDCGSVASFLGYHYQMNGIINTINTACSSSANAIMFGTRLIKNGMAKRAIVGGVDSLSKFTINGFNSLNILSPELCKPFDKDRKGLNLGEGAGFLILESEECVGNKHIYGEVKGYGNTNDAFHPSSLSENGEGPYLAMQKALSIANLEPDQIEYINTHGTGTENNDQVESRAMIRLFETTPAFSSTKSNTGHTLGAAGAIEAIFCILNLEHQEVYPSANFGNPIEDTGLIPVLMHEKKTLNHVMSNSFGFGGNCTSLVFSKV
jgi:3-oxoacyl-(acyl-carrier-protein) synthase